MQGSCATLVSARAATHRAWMTLLAYLVALKLASTTFAPSDGRKAPTIQVKVATLASLLTNSVDHSKTVRMESFFCGTQWDFYQRYSAKVAKRLVVLN